MSPCSEADVGLACPVRRIVARTEAWAGEVGDFVVLHASFGGEVDEAFVAGTAQFLVGFGDKPLFAHGE